MPFHDGNETVNPLRALLRWLAGLISRR